MPGRLKRVPAKNTRADGGVPELKAVAGCTLPRNPSGRSMVKSRVAVAASSSRRPNSRNGGVAAGGGVMRLSLPASTKTCGRSVPEVPA